SAQMVRWGQAAYSQEALETARKVFRPDLYDAALGAPKTPVGAIQDSVGAFDGPLFNPNDIPAHLASVTIKRRQL
nr:nitrate transporter [Afipia sp.]